MPLPPDLHAADYPTYTAAMNTQTLQRTTFTWMDLAHTVLRDIHPIVLTGQVDFADDNAADVLTTLAAGFYDVDHALEVDSDSPSDGVAGMNRLIRATVSHYIDPLARWVSVPVFTGRPSVITRDGEQVTISAQDKACFHLRTVKAHKIDKGTPVIKAIHDGLYATGERFFRFPPTHSIPDRVSKDTTIGGPDTDHQPWKVWRKLAKDAGLQLYPDGAGYFVLRKYPTGTPLVTWDARNLTSNVVAETDLTEIHNQVIAHGHKKETFTATAKASHDLSPRNLAINDVPWTNTLHVDAPHLRGKALERFAYRHLAKALTEGVKVTGNVVPIFHAAPLDRARVTTRQGAVSFALRDATMPLESDADMPIGTQLHVPRAAVGLVSA